MENTVLITSESLQPLVDKYFEKITAAQWSMLAAGTWDSSTEATLADMLIEIVQTLSADVLRLVIPKFQDRLIAEPKYGEKSALEDFNVKACLGDSLSDSFAGALKVPRNKCESAEKLTDLVESEVSQKVKSFLSVAANCPVWPDDPAVYVNGSMSNISSLKRMLIHATNCLKKFTSRLNFQFLGTCMGSKSAEIFINRSCESKVYSLARERCESSQSIKSKISVASAVQSVGEILQKWSDQTSDTEVVENAKPSPDTSLEAHFAAADIVNQMICDLQDPTHSGVNMGSIHDMVRTFFSPKATPTEDTSNKNEKVSKVKFHKVVSNQVEHMMGELQKSFKKQQGNFVVSLQKVAEFAKRSANCLRNCKPSDGLPGFIPERSTELKVRVQTQNTAMFPVRKNRSSPLDQVDVTEEVESLFAKINSPRISAAQAKKTLEDIMSSNEIKTFSKELTDKMYDHMISSHTYLLPLPQLGKCLSDSVISKKRKDGDHFQTSPEVLYAMTEDLVRKFLQKVLIWLQKEPTANTKHNETLSGALTDIENLIPALLNQPEEESYLQTKVPSQLSSGDIESEYSPSCQSYSLILRHIDSYLLTKRNKWVVSESSTPLESSQISLGLLSSSNNYPTSSEKSTSTVLSVPSVTTTPECIRKTNSLTTALMVKLQSKAPKKSRTALQMENINTVIKRLSDKICDEIDFSAIGQIKDNKQFNKSLLKDLKKEFGSPKETLKAALSDETAFDDAVLKYLKIHLEALNAPKQNAVYRVFAAIGTAIMKPFTMCMSAEDSNDPPFSTPQSPDHQIRNPNLAPCCVISHRYFDSRCLPLRCGGKRHM